MNDVKKIWLVEDNQRELEMLSSTITFVADELGIRIEIFAARNGKEALASLNACTANHQLPRLIITDLDMSVLCGYTFVAKAKANPRFKRIPIVVFSSLSQEEEVKKALELGANSYVNKPFGMSALELAVEAMLYNWLVINRFA